MNNKGFIATSLIYSFFLIFITLFLTIIADYLQNKVLLNTVEKSIKEDINNTMGIQDFEVGDKLYFNSDLSVIDGGTISVGFYYVCSIQYKNSELDPDDTLVLSKNTDCNEPTNLVITGKRLKIEKNNIDTNDVINIVGWSNE